jgi:hypothetical protein
MEYRIEYKLTDIEWHIWANPIIGLNSESLQIAVMASKYSVLSFFLTTEWN